MKTLSAQPAGRSPRGLGALPFLLALPCAGVSTAPDATRTWLGIGPDGRRSLGSNWLGGVPADGDDVVFDGGAHNLVSTLDFTFSLNSLRLAASSGHR